MPDLFDTVVDTSPGLALISPPVSVVKISNPGLVTTRAAVTIPQVAILDISLKAKELSSKINWVSTQRKVEYVPQLLGLLTHTSVLVRRNVLKAIENIGNKDTAQNLKPRLSQETDRATLILLENVIDKLQRETSDLVKSKNIYQVSELLQTIKQLIGAKNFVVEGEVGEINIYHQMVYFSLKDSTTDDRLDCMAFYTVLNRLDFTLNEGLSIRITGKAGLAKGSRLRLQVTQIQLTGEGEFLRNLKLLQIKLETEGLFDPLRKRPLPLLPKKIALLVSRGSAAESDFLKILGERRQSIEVCVVPIKTQGDGALQILLNCLQFLQVELDTPGSSLGDCEAVIITRGGGSKDDLSVFNQEQIVRSVHGLKIPSIVAIGHEKDWSLAEMAADQRASTPSQAATIVSLSDSEVQSQLNGYLLRICLWMNQKYDSYYSFSDRQMVVINHRIQTKLTQVYELLQKLDILTANFVSRIQQMLLQTYFEISCSIEHKWQVVNLAVTQSVSLSPYLRVKAEKTHEASNYAMQAIELALKNQLDKTEQRFQFLNQTIATFDTQKVLQRGFALLRDPQGRIVERWSDATASKLRLTLQDGDKDIEV